MTNIHIETPQCWHLRCALNFDNVTTLMTEMQNLQQQHGMPAVLDLQDVKHTDSAGLALLIEWLNEAKRADKSLKFQHLPSQLLTLATVGGVEDLFT